MASKIKAALAQPELIPHGALKPLAQRIVNAEARFCELVENIAGVCADDARAILAVYLRLKVAKIDGGIHAVNVTHGAYMEREPMLRALAISKGAA